VGKAACDAVQPCPRRSNLRRVSLKQVDLYAVVASFHEGYDGEPPEAQVMVKLASREHGASPCEVEPLDINHPSAEFLAWCEEDGEYDESTVRAVLMLHLLMAQHPVQ
jgi:hypothetical protein